MNYIRQGARLFDYYTTAFVWELLFVVSLFSFFSLPFSFAFDILVSGLLDFGGYGWVDGWISSFSVLIKRGYFLSDL